MESSDSGIIERSVCLKKLSLKLRDLPLRRTLKRSPTPKLGDRRPKVDFMVCVNSLFSYLCPEIELNRLSLAKECDIFEGEKLMDSCVNNRHLCLLLFDTLIGARFDKIF